MYGRRREPTAEATLFLSPSLFSCLHSTIRLPCVSGSLSSLLPFSPPIFLFVPLYLSQTERHIQTLGISRCEPKKQGQGVHPRRWDGSASQRRYPGLIGWHRNDSAGCGRESTVYTTERNGETAAFGWSMPTAGGPYQSQSLLSWSSGQANRNRQAHQTQTNFETFHPG